MPGRLKIGGFFLQLAVFLRLITKMADMAMSSPNIIPPHCVGVGISDVLRKGKSAGS